MIIPDKETAKVLNDLARRKDDMAFVLGFITPFIVAIILLAMIAPWM